MENLPLRKLEIPVDEMDHLCHLYEIRDHAQVLAWGVKLLYDLSIAQQKGWHMTMFKSEYTDKGLVFNPDYWYAAFRLENLAPRDDKYCRIDVDNLEEKLKKV
jgi:hypothetical protein